MSIKTVSLRPGKGAGRLGKGREEAEPIPPHPSSPLLTQEHFLLQFKLNHLESFKGQEIHPMWPGRDSKQEEPA